MVRRPNLTSSASSSAAAAAGVTNKTSTSSGMTAPEAGIIKTVYVENFMCHKKLTVDLCRNVNFIHGQNGSGKSAILAALQICLGAGARRTHRARNLKDLVRKDASASVTHAKVRVTLWNQGTDAYQHEVYGDQVTIERIISLRSGGYNGYKLLDHNGVERSRSKKDLDDLLDQLNIQVENPVAVLDQEDAKKFLTGKPQDKYNFFMKATELERMDRQYASISDKLLEMSETKIKVEAGLSDAADKVRKLKKQWEQHQEVEKLEEKLVELNLLYSWAFYHDFEQQYDQMQETLAQIMAKLEKNNLQLSQVEASQDVTSEEEVLKQKVDVLTEEAQQQVQAKRDLEAQVKLALAPCKQLEREHHQLSQRDVPTAERQFQQAQHRLYEARERIKEMAGSAESKEAQRTAALQQAEQDYQIAKEKHSEIKQSVTNALRAYEELEPQVEQAKQNASQVQRRLDAVNRKIDELNSSNGNDSLAVFGSKCSRMRQLVDQARREGKFRGPVVGPIGSHIKIAPGKENLAQIAEFALGASTLDRFVVTNDQDRRVFMDLRQQAKCGASECNCFQVPLHDRYQVPPPPSNEIETVASALKIEDDLVFNCLVDSVRIDQKALAASKEVSEQSLLQVQADGREAIKAQNVKEVYFLPFGDYWSVRKGSRTIISNERKLRQNIGVDRTAAVQETQQEANALKAELAELRQKENQVESHHTQHQREWNKLRRSEGEIRKEIQTLAEKIDQLKAEADMAASSINIDTTDQEEEVEAAERNLQQLKDHAARIAEDIESKKPEINQLRAKLTDITKRNEKVLEDLKVAEEQLGNFMQTLSQREKMIEKRRDKVQKLKAIVDDHKQKMQNVAVARDQALRNARTLTFQRQTSKSRKEKQSFDEDNETMDVDPTDEDIEEIEPMPTDKDTKTYEAKIRRTEKQIQKERENRKVANEDPAVAYQKYIRANNELQQKLTEIENISKNEVRLQKDLRQRQEMWKAFRAHLVVMTNSRFDEILQLKGSAGELDFDHEEGSLNLIVQKDNNDSSSQTNDVKALSGGERSFTTLSLLLALGESLETPFRVMDEFDVFLDPVARKIALDTLVEIGKRLDHRQFIFITPQDLSILTPDDKLRIKKLKAPERTNVVGGPEQQTLNFGSQAAA